MNHKQVGHLWNGNAEAWTKLARAGYDVYRDYLNTPAFFEMLPNIRGISGIDIGCGEGHNTRLLARQGARITAIDISEVFIKQASDVEENEPLGINYQLASAVELPFPDATFDFATGFMSFMDIPETENVLLEAYRVLKPGGFLQFSICHPCFDTPHRRNLRDDKGHTYAIEVGEYFRNLNGEVSEWLFGAAPREAKVDLPKFKVPRFNMTLSQWFNLLIGIGFRLECIREPRPDDEVVRSCPDLQDAQVVAYFLHIRVRKPLEEENGKQQAALEYSSVLYDEP
ncbi:MAG: methyltransferase domain-containing protein [Candidatus Aegiribacteria sp.]|nr:methyltransferase domain-containing protein [Candidatus Aegiribacteria sp.]